MGKNIVTNFPVSVYGKMESFSDTISKGRCRVFYKGENRNGTYITDEFAQKLIDSAPYTPVKGIYNGEEGDYTDHGAKRSDGRIYGIVPAAPNFAWEKHLDDDGVEREYACFDVLYYTALYEEAGQIDGKSESMELYRKTLKGDWRFINGKKLYVFTDGCFLGLQALGDDVDPCFEGASFYNCESNILALLEKYEKRLPLIQEDQKQGEETMSMVNFKVSDRQKYEFLFNLLNPNFTEEGGWTIECVICEVYDEYAITRNCAEETFERVFYKKDDETDSLEIVNRERCFILDVSEAERSALEEIRGQGTYSAAAEGIVAQAATIIALGEEKETLNNSLNTLKEENEKIIGENSELSTKNEELSNTIITLTTERDSANAEYQSALDSLTEAQNSCSELNTKLSEVVAERDALASYKKATEDNKKKAVVDTYNGLVAEDVIETYLENLDNYTLEQLDKELTYEQKKANPNLFSAKQEPGVVYIPKESEGCGRSVSDILAKYEK